MAEEENELDIYSLVQLALTQREHVQSFLEICYIIFKSREDDEKADAAKNYLQDLDLQRQLSFLSALKENQEQKTEYYDKDKGEEDPLKYRRETEQKTLDIKLEMLSYLGEIIKEITEEEAIDLED